MSRLAGLSVIFAFTALVGCASTNPLDEDGGIPIDHPDAMKGMPDAEPGAPDAPGRPDAGPPDAMIPLPPDSSIPLPPDAAVMPPDASIPHPDASIPHPDASTGCTTSTVNLLSNANFDTGPGTMWAETGSAGELILATSALMGHTPQSGGYAAWIGGYTGGTDTLTQTVAVPAGTTAIRFKGQQWTETAETDSDIFDKLDFQILPSGTGNTVLESIGGSPVLTDNSGTTTWTAFDFPVTGSYAGQTIRLRIKGANDGFFGTSWFIDTIALEATVCQ
jgi:hypothetical protein